MSGSSGDAGRQIRRLVDEIVGLSKQECSPQIFFHEFLDRVIAALAAVGGAVWTFDENGGVELRYQANLRESQISQNREDVANHRRLVQRVFDKGQGALIPPHSVSLNQGANPTDYLILLCPVIAGRMTHSVVEIFQRPNPSVKAQQGYLRFLQQMLQSSRRVCRSVGDDTITHAHLRRACVLEQLDELGLGPTEQQYLRLLADGPMRLNVLASAIGLPPRTISQVTEPFLVRAGLIAKDDQSKRQLTAHGYEHIGKRKAKKKELQ
jgi:hypothetical protein